MDNNTHTTHVDNTPISRASSDASKNFMNTLFSLINMIDALKSKISDEEYLKLCNELMELSDYNLKLVDEENRLVDLHVAVLESSPLIRDENRRASYTNILDRESREDLSDAAKIKSGQYWICEYCDKVLAKSTTKSGHYNSRTCKRTRRTKSLTKDLGTTDTKAATRVVIAINGHAAKKEKNYLDFKEAVKEEKIKRARENNTACES
tara:strand:+ start:400 stop:1023 length:624 start_codon:yes stop_codon:yes gene_type:complete